MVELQVSDKVCGCIAKKKKITQEYVTKMA